MPSGDADDLELVAFAHTLADVAARETLPRFRQKLDVVNKSSAQGSIFDPVTEADRAAERRMTDAIVTRWPAHGIFGEEYGATNKGAKFEWVLDPIDGTRAFICGAPTWGTLIGLTENGVARIGMMDQPFTRERFWADRSGAHMRSGRDAATSLSTSGCARLADALVTSTSPALFADGPDRVAFGMVAERARQVRYGLDCYGYCLLALGTIDLVVEAGLSTYDVVALIPIIEQAGGVITTWEGGRPEAGGRIVAAATAELHREALGLLSRVTARE